MSNMLKATTYLSKTYYKRLKDISHSRGLPMARLLMYAVERELVTERPFNFDYSLPTEEYIEYAYAEEAGKIITFMSTLRDGMGLDLLVMLRHDIGIPEKETFLLAFRECIEKEMVESFKPVNKEGRVPHADNYLHYKVKKNKGSKLDKEAKEYAKYQKLKKKYGDK